MKLREAVRIGRFCGLKTIPECIGNIELHWSNVFEYSKVNKEFNELYEEYDKYKAGDLIIDFDEIDKENEIAMQELK